MRAALSGYVINISSTSGIRGVPCYECYTGKFSIFFIYSLYFLPIKISEKVIQDKDNLDIFKKLNIEASLDLFLFCSMGSIFASFLPLIAFVIYWPKHLAPDFALASCHVLPHPILSSFVLSYPLLSYPILSYPLLSYLILSHSFISHPILSYSFLSHLIPFHPI